jgi:hypothetical protein
MELKANHIVLLRRLLAEKLMGLQESTDYDYKTTVESLIVQLTLEECRLADQT